MCMPYYDTLQVMDYNPNYQMPVWKVCPVGCKKGYTE